MLLKFIYRSSVQLYCWLHICFYDTDGIVQQLYGTANTFFGDMTIISGRAFPSEYFPHLLPIFHPLDLFIKILNLKQKIQKRLNTCRKSKGMVRLLQLKTSTPVLRLMIESAAQLLLATKKHIVVKHV